MKSDLSLSGPAAYRSLEQSLLPRLALIMMLASGFAGLGYQIVWTHQSALWLGHESVAVLAVVTAFFSGLGIGALVLGHRIDRSGHPARWYAACEAMIAAWSLALALLLAPISAWMVALIGAQPEPWWHWTVAFVGTFFVLLPATAAMGATLPAMERLVAQVNVGVRNIAALYAANTLGATLGVLATAFWLVPAFGLVRTAVVCAALNLICALTALVLPTQARSAPPSAASPLGTGPLWLLAATGLLGIAYEVVVVRVLSQIAEDTVYTFAMLLAVYLLGSAIGAAAYRRWQSLVGDAGVLQSRLLCLQAAACLFGTLTLWGAGPLQRLVHEALGAGMASAIAAEAAIALAAFGLPTLMMGALFSHLGTRARESGYSLGRAFGFNTLGAAAAPPLCGMLVVPMLGPKSALVIIALGYLVLAWRTAARRPLFWITALATMFLAGWAPSLAIVDVPPGGRLLSYRDGAMAAVSVVEDAGGVATLRINNRQQEGSSNTLFTDARQALLPLLLHPAPRRALFLGLGTGTTAASAAEDPTVQVDAVELLPEVIEASVHFAGPFRRDGIEPKLHVTAADARRFVKAPGHFYDVVVSDNFHPARTGSGSLYTVEHFEAVRDRLTAQGVFCQWLPLHQLDLDTLRSIVRSFVAVYPGGWAMLATNSLETPVIGLVARRDAAVMRWDDLRQRLAHPTTPQRLTEFGIADEFALLGGFIAGPSALGRFAGAAPLNTDDRPVVAYQAPRVTYAPASLPRDRLLSLLQQVQLEPGELVDAGPDTSSPQRLLAYWRARTHFVEVGQRVKASTDLREMLQQVREPLLSVLRISPDFRPAYDPLLRMATELGRSDPSAAKALLSELARLQPARPDAQEALRKLTAAPS
ncbi:MAG: fused MFS/spermidine synthase [Burkholderiaceae bacterium]